MLVVEPLVRVTTLTHRQCIWHAAVSVVKCSGLVIVTSISTSIIGRGSSHIVVKNFNINWSRNLVAYHFKLGFVPSDHFSCTCVALSQWWHWSFWWYSLQFALTCSMSIVSCNLSCLPFVFNVWWKHLILYLYFVWLVVIIGLVYDLAAHRTVVSILPVRKMRISLWNRWTLWSVLLYFLIRAALCRCVLMTFWHPIVPTLRKQTLVVKHLVFGLGKVLDFFGLRHHMRIRFTWVSHLSLCINILSLLAFSVCADSSWLALWYLFEFTGASHSHLLGACRSWLNNPSSLLGHNSIQKFCRV